MALSGGELYGPVHRISDAGTAALACRGQRVRARTGAEPIDTDQTDRAHLQGPDGRHGPALRASTAGLFGLAHVGQSLYLAAADGPRPDRGAVGVWPRGGRTTLRQRLFLRHENSVVVFYSIYEACFDLLSLCGRVGRFPMRHRGRSE